MEEAIREQNRLAGRKYTTGHELSLVKAISGKSPQAEGSLS
jgi:hypothetical protein